MILYYTASQKTKVFAEALHDVLGLPLHELKSPLNDRKPFSFMCKALILSVTGKGFPVSNMPAKLTGDTIYVCTPVWGGRVASPVKYFLENADLQGKTVHLLLTCGSVASGEKYSRNALEALKSVKCIPGEAYAFATSKTPPERAVIAEQLRVMLPEAAHK